MSNDLMLNCLENVLHENDITAYDIGNDSDLCICLSYENSRWLTYSVERGQRFSIRTFDYLSAACINMIMRLSDSEKKEDLLINQFVECIEKESSALEK